MNHKLPHQGLEKTPWERLLVSSLVGDKFSFPSHSDPAEPSLRALGGWIPIYSFSGSLPPSSLSSLSSHHRCSGGFIPIVYWAKSSRFCLLKIPLKYFSALPPSLCYDCGHREILFLFLLLFYAPFWWKVLFQLRIHRFCHWIKCKHQNPWGIFSVH